MRRYVFMGVREAPRPRPVRVMHFEVMAFDRDGELHASAFVDGSYRAAKRTGTRYLRDVTVGHVTIAVRRGPRAEDWAVQLARGHGEPQWQRVMRVEVVS